MGTCSSADNVSSTQKLSKPRPLFAEVNNDIDVNNMFRKLQDDLKKLNTMNLEQQQRQQDINKQLEVNQSSVDIHKTIKTILTAIQVLNDCDLTNVGDVPLSEKYPYFSKKLRNCNKNKELKELISSYKKLIKSIYANQEFVQQILDQISNIEKYLNDNRSGQLTQDQYSQNVAQLKSSREKVLQYNNQVIQPLAQDHTYAVTHYSSISEQLHEKSQYCIDEKKFSLNSIASSIFLPNTQVSI